MDVSLGIVAITRNQQLFQYVWQTVAVFCLLVLVFTVHRKNGKLTLENRVGKMALCLLIGGIVIYACVGFIFLMSWIVGGDFTF